jgi:hypothetical protein
MVLWRSFVIPSGHIEKASLFSSNLTNPRPVLRCTQVPIKKNTQKTRISVRRCDMNSTAEKTVGFGETPESLGQKDLTHVTFVSN